MTCTLITGAGSGIGQQIAVELCGSRNLILCGRSADRLEETLRLVHGKSKQIYIWEYDLELVEGIKASLEAFLTANNLFVDGFIHCAGKMSVLHMRMADYKNTLKIFNVNVFSATEIVALLLKKRNKEHLKNIVFISAILAQFGAKGHNLYSATKAALNGLMRSLAVELAPEIRVNSVLPGGIRTPMSEAAFKDPVIVEKFRAEYPLGIGDTQDIADMVYFLLSDKAKWITGQEMVVDGGRTINMSHK